MTYTQRNNHPPVPGNAWVDNTEVATPLPSFGTVRLFAKSGSLLGIVWSLLALAAQANQPVGFKDILPTAFAMSGLNAVGFLLGSASLLLYFHGSHSRISRTAAKIGGALNVVWALGCIAANQYFLPLGIETENSFPVANSPPSISIACTALLCLGSAILTLPIKTVSGHRPTQYLAGTLILMGAIPGTGYLYDIPLLYDSPRYGPIDASSAILCVVLGIGLLALHPTEGFMRTLMSPAIGSALLRRLVPIVVGLPILAGWLRILAQRQNWYSFDFGVAVVIGLVLLILLASLWYLAGWVNRIDQERYNVVQAWTEQETKLRLATAAARIGYWRWMQSQNIIEVDQVSAELLGFSSNSPIPFDVFIHAIQQEDRGNFLQAFEQAQEENRSFRIECRPNLATHISWISVKGYPSETSYYQVHGIVADITEQRQTQQALLDSQQRLQSIVQSAMDATITVDHDQNIILFNKAAEQLFQCSADDALGTPISRFIPKRARERHPTHVMMFQQSDAVARSMGIPGFISALRTDGHEFPIEASISQVIVAGQSMCTVILRDITERFRSEAALREREARFRNMADSAPVMMFITDSTGLCTYLNRQWYEFTGQTMETGANTEWLNHVHEADRGPLIGLLNKHDDVQLRRVECRVRRHDGELRWGLCSIHSMVDDQGSTGGCIASIIDITDHKRAEQTLKQSAEELENQVADRTAALSHSQERLRALTYQLTRAEHAERKRIAGELHNYLAQLLVAAHLKLAQGTLPLMDDRDRALVQDLESILDEALTYTRSLVAKLSPPVLYHLGLPAALQWLAEQMEEHQLMVETVFDLPPTLQKLPDDVAAILFQSVRELLFNVVKHADSLEAQIALRTTPDQTLVIVVTDQGRGFDVSQLDQSFGSTTSFGLFSVTERLEALGGSMHIDTRVGHGTSITLLCPFATWGRTGAASPEVEEQEGASVSPKLTDSRPVRILLVDDHAMVRQGIRALLERHDDLLVVGEAYDGQHACELADALRPDVIVMDANMPRLDGIEATRHIKALYPRMVIIGLSVQTASQVASSMIQAGANCYLTKESAGEQLYESIITAISERGCSDSNLL